ncbi:hypothetical protein A3B57_02000 [Microgenomates group bacterium RIFCSPLOWO2_01_FULL_47_10]|nr:MAG: hypothetical protein A3B57_02000 [Microgenomates group bacterium RIFCSPLOWO2_01_FULL_47_10]
MSENFPDTKDKQLIKALASLKTPAEVQAFLRDIFTISEIKEAANRFEMARLLWSTKKSYLEIAAATKASATTVTRVADWLFKKGGSGYQVALKRLFPSKKS